MADKRDHQYDRAKVAVAAAGLLIVVLVVIAVAAPDVGDIARFRDALRGRDSSTDEVSPSPVADVQLPDVEWSRLIVPLEYLNQPTWVQIEYPAEWFVDVAEYFVGVRSDTDFGAWDASSVNAEFVVEVAEADLAETDEGSQTSPGQDATDSVIDGYSATRFDYRPEEDQDPGEWGFLGEWGFVVDAEKEGFRYTVLAEVCCTAEADEAAPHLALLEEMLARLRLVDPPLSDEAWTTSILETDLHPTQWNSVQPADRLFLEWHLWHPENWLAETVSRETGEWRLSGDANDESHRAAVQIQMEPISEDAWEAAEDQALWTERDWSPEKALPGIGMRARRLPDEIGPDGEWRIILLLNDMAGPWRLTADFNLEGDSPEARQWAQAIMQRVLKRSAHCWTGGRTGYPYSACSSG